MIKVLFSHRTVLLVVILSTLFVETGCAAKLPSKSVTENPSITATSVTTLPATSQHPATSSSTHTTQPTLTATRSVLLTHTPAPSPEPTVTPSQTPSPVPSSTPQPTSAPLVLENIQVFFSIVINEYIAQQNANELKKVTEIWQVLADGSNKRQLFMEKLEGEWNSSLGHLALSHSGHNLAFVRFVDKRATATWSSSLWVIEVDGSNQRELFSKSDMMPGSLNWSEQDEANLSAKERPMFPIWSPDDSWIAFVDWLTFSQGEPGRIYILNIESGQSRVLGEGEIYAWSPSGDALAMYSERLFSSMHNLRIVNLQGDVVSTLALPTSTFLKSLHWSASTGLIVAQGADYEKQMYPIFVIDPDKNTVEKVVDDGHNTRGFGPQFSPSGKMISFGHTVEGSTNLYVLDLDSGLTRQVIPQIESQAIWSPDSMYVLVQSKVQGNGLYIASVLNEQYWKIPDLSNTDKDVWFSSYDWQFTIQ